MSLGQNTRNTTEEHQQQQGVAKACFNQTLNVRIQFANYVGWYFLIDRCRCSPKDPLLQDLTQFKIPQDSYFRLSIGLHQFVLHEPQSIP